MALYYRYINALYIFKKCIIPKCNCLSEVRRNLTLRVCSVAEDYYIYTAEILLYLAKV